MNAAPYTTHAVSSRDGPENSSRPLQGRPGKRFRFPALCGLTWWFLFLSVVPAIALTPG